MVINWLMNINILGYVTSDPVGSRPTWRQHVLINIHETSILSMLEVQKYCNLLNNTYYVVVKIY